MVTGKSHKPTRFARFVLYPLGAVFFLFVLIIILTLASGYRFTYQNGRVGLTKTGMLIITTRPFDALVSINNKATKYRTSFYLLPTKIAGLNPGEYDVELSKNGYRTWKNKMAITPNMVTWANYVLLFAEKLNIAPIDVPGGKVIARSENGRHILFSDTTKNVFGLKSLDTNNLSVRNFWPQATPLEPWLLEPQILTAEYSVNSDRVLLRVTNGSRTEYVVADASSNQPKLIHLNTTLKQDFTNAWWSKINDSEMYLQTKNGISLVNVNDTTLVKPLASDVVTFHVDESRQIFYVEKNQTGTYSVIRMNLDGNNKTTVVDSVAPAKAFKLGYSNQNSILTVLNIDTGDLTAYYLGNSNKKYSVKLSGGAVDFSWYKNGQMILYFGKDFIKRYDLEKSKEIDVRLIESPQRVEWYFDENHYLVTGTSDVYEIDYDGTNKVPISESSVTVSVLDQLNNNIIFANKNESGKGIFSKYVSEF